MPPLLYLDTARLGQMTPAAKDAQLDFVRLSAEEPSSLYFEQFLRDGFSAWPASYQERFPGLRSWAGVSGLKQSICRLANAPTDWQVLLASRSLSLVRLASGCMFRVCRNVLATDLSWPTYKQAIEAKARLTGNQITTVPLRDGILHRHWTVKDVSDFLATAFAEHRCDGLFLPAVDHLGVRLPVQDIVQQIERRSELRFCFIDAAQAFCHMPLGDCLTVADFIVAGSHKWMGAYLPAGIGLFGQRRSREMIERRVRPFGNDSLPDDPLLHFTEQLDAGQLDGHSETTNLTSFFACAGAVADNLSPRARKPPPILESCLDMLRRPPGGWELVQPVREMRSRIALLRRGPKHSRRDPNSLRLAWLQAGFAVSAYGDGTVRLSFPQDLS